MTSVPTFVVVSLCCPALHVYASLRFVHLAALILYFVSPCQSIDSRLHPACIKNMVTYTLHGKQNPSIVYTSGKKLNVGLEYEYMVSGCSAHCFSYREIPIAKHAQYEFTLKYTNHLLPSPSPKSASCARAYTGSLMLAHGAAVVIGYSYLTISWL
jgi:hypothetical protein